MEETYETQLPLLRRRLEATGVTHSELMDLYYAESAEVEEEHARCSSAWREAKTEYRIWDRYFPTEPFPGALIRKTSAAVAPSLPVRSSRPASRPRLNKEWIHDLSEPGPTDRQKAHYVPTRGDFTDRYKGEAYPDFGSGDYYRPSLVKPVQAPNILTAPAPALLQAPTHPKSLAQEDLRQYDQQNPIRLSRSEGLAGLVPAKVGAAIIPATVVQGPKPRGRLTQAEMRKYDEANPTRLSIEPISNTRDFASSIYTAPSVPATLVIPSSSDTTDSFPSGYSTAAHPLMRASSLSTKKGRRVFIGNLPATTTDDLRILFRDYHIEDIYIPTNPRTNRQDNCFGFVELRSSSEAHKLIARFHGVKFRGHSLQISFAKTKDGDRVQENQDIDDRGMGISRGGRPQAKPIAYSIAIHRTAEGRRLLLGNLSPQTKKKDLSDFLIGFCVRGMQIFRNDQPPYLVYAFIDMESPEGARKAIARLSGNIMLNRRVTITLATEATVSAHYRGDWAEFKRLCGAELGCQEVLYTGQEKVMAQRATKGDFRHDLFVFLQKVRDEVRRSHPDCNRYIRGYLSDKLTWAHFFQDPFPGIEPLIGHTESCLQSMGRLATASRPVLEAATPSRSVPTNLSSNLVSHRVTAMRPSMPSGDLAAAMKSTVAINGPGKVIKTEPMDDIYYTGVAESALTSASVADAQIEMTGNRIVPKPRDRNLSSRSQTPKAPLPAQPAPDLARSNSASIMTSAAHAKAVLVGGTDSVTFSSPAAVMTDVTGSDPAVSKPPDVSMDPKECWNTFKDKFNMDEAAKAQLEQEIQAQGQMRMVLDVSTGQTVTVEELVRRTQIRATLKMKLAGNSKGFLAPLAHVEDDGLTKANVPVKRKQGDENDDDEMGGNEDERAQKKARKFLDSFEKEYTK